MISVIVPIYNAEKNLRRCIDSILGQTFEDFELLLIDDGSNDSSLHICRSFEKIDNRIKVYTRENKGVSFTRNQGIELSKGEYIQFIDSDDYMSKYMLENQMEAMKNDTDLVICGYTEFKNTSSEERLPLIQGKILLEDIHAAYPSIFEKFMLNPVWNKLYVREKIVKGFDKNNSLGEDLIFNLEYLDNCTSISFVQDSLYNYDDTGSGLNSIYRDNYLEIQEMLFAKSLEFIEKFNIGKQALVDVSSIFIQFVLYGLIDSYCLSSMSEDKKKEIFVKWSKNKNVLYASKTAVIRQFKYKLLHFILKNKMYTCFKCLMKLKG